MQPVDAKRWETLDSVTISELSSDRREVRVRVDPSIPLIDPESVEAYNFI